MLKTDPAFIQSFPPEHGPAIPRAVLGALTSSVRPEVFIKELSILYSPALMGRFDITHDGVKNLMAGKSSLSSVGAWSTRYGGHQFGHWAGQLGDGRAMTLGFPIDKEGFGWEWQLKGSGQTPYSRMGDGYAVMRSSYREFVASEALHALGVPTTRALGLISTGRWVRRDFFYDGNPKDEVGAVCLRVAPSFLRFGHFQILQATKEKELLEKLFAFVLSKHFSAEALAHPGLEHFDKDFSQTNLSSSAPKSPFGSKNLSDPDRALKLFEWIGQRTLQTIVHWWRVGFTHGVMNTDNMSIHGLTIDYGPFGWLSSLDPQFTPNTTDFRERRYAFGNQPAIAIWNLAQLASSFAVLDPREGEFEKVLTGFETFFESRFLEMINLKMGLPAQTKSKELIQRVLQFLHRAQFDYTLFWRAWSHWASKGVKARFKREGKEDGSYSEPTGQATTRDQNTDLSLNWFNSLERFKYGEFKSESEKAELQKEFTDLISEFFDKLFLESKALAQQQIIEQVGLSFSQNPVFIPRNHLLYQATQELEATGTSWINSSISQESPFAQALFDCSLDPYSIRSWEQDYFLERGSAPPEFDLYSKVPDWGLKTPGCSQLSCSS